MAARLFSSLFACAKSRWNKQAINITEWRYEGPNNEDLSYYYYHTFVCVNYLIGTFVRTKVFRTNKQGIIDWHVPRSYVSNLPWLIVDYDIVNYDVVDYDIAI